MTDDLKAILESAASATHEKLGKPTDHNELVDEFGRQFDALGTKYHYETPDSSAAGSDCNPDFDITEDGKTVAHVRIKAGRCCPLSSDFKDQLKKHKDSHGTDLYSVHFKPDGAVVKKFEE